MSVCDTDACRCDPVGAHRFCADAGSARPLHELTQLIEARSGGALTFNFASLYATLYKLEERRWIQGRWIEKAGQRRRRYYRITPEGRTVLAAQRKEWRQFFELIRELAGVEYA